MRFLKVSIVLIILFSLINCATGSHIVTGERRPPIDPAHVRLFLDPPPRYETIGLVEAASDVDLSSQKAQDRALNELKKQAAKIGANGVILQNVDTTTAGAGGFLGSGFGGQTGAITGSIMFGTSGSKTTKKAKGIAILVLEESSDNE